MKIGEKGCQEGTINLQKFFNLELGRKTSLYKRKSKAENRHFAVEYTRKLAMTAIALESFSISNCCAFLHCTNCPINLFLISLEEKDIYIKNPRG